MILIQYCLVILLQHCSNIVWERTFIYCNNVAAILQKYCYNIAVYTIITQNSILFIVSNEQEYLNLFQMVYHRNRNLARLSRRGSGLRRWTFGRQFDLATDPSSLAQHSQGGLCPKGCAL